MRVSNADMGTLQYIEETDSSGGIPAFLSENLYFATRFMISKKAILFIAAL